VLYIIDINTVFFFLNTQNVVYTLEQT
jgi:hypothetical protein